MKRANVGKDKEELDEDLPPTQHIDEDMEHDGGGDDEAEGYMEEDNGGMPEQPDIGWYLSHWEMTNQGKIAICRTFANYLAAQMPKVVDGPRAGYKTPRRVARK